MDAIISHLQAWLIHLLEPHSLAQLLVIITAAGIAYVVDAHLDRFVIGHPEDVGLRRLALRTAQRIVFPISALVGVLAGRAVLNALDWPVEVLNIAVPMMLSLAGVRLAVFLLRKSFTPSARLKAWEGLISTAAWTIVALHLAGWLPRVLAAMDSVAFDAGKMHFSLLSFSKMLLFLAVLLSLAVWIAGIIETQLQKAEHVSPGMQVGLAKVSKVLLTGLAVVIGLNAVGIDLTAFAVFGGALGVGLGFGLQRIASNFISGFILLMDRSIRPGDVITVGNSFGWVQSLRARYVVVRNRDGVDTLIPNESLITSEVVNWSYSDRKVRVRLPVQISYEDDPEQAMALMLAAAQKCDRVLPEPAPVCRFMEFADSGLKLELRFWLNDPEDGVGNARSTINLAIWKAFQETGIRFPYPQRDLHIKELPMPWMEVLRPKDDSAAA
jgi:small-conductance mechanosensitive channel